jgi:hypothetical protein
MSPERPNLLVDTGVDDVVTPLAAAPNTLASTGAQPASVVAAP